MSAQSRGLPLRQRVIRSGDWLSDSAFIAHRDLQIFGAVWASLPFDGTWDLGNPPQLVGPAAYDLSYIVEAATYRTQQCVVLTADRLTFDPAASPLPPEEVWAVLDIDYDQVYRFDGRIADAATVGDHMRKGAAQWSWRVHTANTPAPTLVGYLDDRAVFFLAALDQGEGTS